MDECRLCGLCQDVEGELCSACSEQVAGPGDGD